MVKKHNFTDLGYNEKKYPKALNFACIYFFPIRLHHNKENDI